MFLANQKQGLHFDKDTCFTKRTYVHVQSHTVPA